MLVRVLSEELEPSYRSGFPADQALKLSANARLDTNNRADAVIIVFIICFLSNLPKFRMSAPEDPLLIPDLSHPAEPWCLPSGLWLGNRLGKTSLDIPYEIIGV